MAKVLIEAVDPRKCIIQLHEDTYLHHILAGHPEVQQEWIRAAIEQPSFIAQDADSPLREVFYKMDLFTNSKIWMCIVIERNFVITAYRTRRGKQGEKIIWIAKS